MKIWKYLFLFLFLTATTIWLSVFFFPDKKLHLITCDVGQGDAILLVFGKTQFLIDGGPGSNVINCLSKHLPFWDRTLEGVFLTHPERDHYLGLIDVVQRYKVEYFFATALASSDPEYQVLVNEVGGRGIRVINPTDGLKVGNSLIYLDVVFPSEEYLNQNFDAKGCQKSSLNSCPSRSPKNEFSIVTLLRFGSFSAILSGDINQKISNQLAVSQLTNKVVFLKVPHHGSKNGLTKDLLEKIEPEIAVISVGKNSYGHPHQETLDLLNEFGVVTFRTDLSGEMEVITNGQDWWVKKKMGLNRIL